MKQSEQFYALSQKPRRRNLFVCCYKFNVVKGYETVTHSLWIYSGLICHSFSNLCGKTLDWSPIGKYRKKTLDNAHLGHLHITSLQVGVLGVHTDILLLVWCWNFLKAYFLWYFFYECCCEFHCNVITILLQLKKFAFYSYHTGHLIQ